MNHIKQEIEVYEYNVYDIARHMREYISEGWRVHTCLEKNGKVIVVYEKELESWN